MSRVERIVSDDVSGADGWTIVAANPDGGVLHPHSVAPGAAVHPRVDKQGSAGRRSAVDTRPEAEVMLVALRPSSGEVLAVAQTGKADEKGDLALTGQYPPGRRLRSSPRRRGPAGAGADPPCRARTMTLGPRW